MNDIRIGEVAEKYETSGRGPGYISNGDRWDPGGDSYGSYQLASAVGTLDGYLKSNLPYTKELRQYTPKTIAFNQLWKKIALNDPEGFKQSQFDFVCTISYIPARVYADKLDWPNTLAINSALFSISNQHGGWKHIFDNVGHYDNETDLLNTLYKRRAGYILSLNKLSTSIKNNIIKERCENELQDVLKLVGEQ